MKRLVNVDIPTAEGNFEFIAYENIDNKDMPHLALVSKDCDMSRTVNVRIHSECMTGDVFGSKRCECGEQLHSSMDYISKNGGIVIYLRQEGRGIGLVNKLHAYVKQDEGFDTAEANKILGFEYDERTYGDAIVILKDLNIKSINILTNNPEKISAFEGSGIEVKKRIAIDIKPNAINLLYLKTKKEKFGHLLRML